MNRTACKRDDCLGHASVPLDGSSLRCALLPSTKHPARRPYKLLRINTASPGHKIENSAVP